MLINNGQFLCLFSYRGVRQWISLKMAIASPLTLMTEAFSITR